MRTYEVYAQLPPLQHPRTREWISNLRPVGVVFAENGEDAIEQARGRFLNGKLLYPVVREVIETVAVVHQRRVKEAV